MTAIGARILGLISRPSTSGGFVPEMDGLRFVAIAWVVLYHVAALRSPDVPAALRAGCDSGHYGVELFFIISGFVLALPFATWRLKEGGPVVLKRYYLRRLTRLEPQARKVHEGEMEKFLFGEGASRIEGYVATEAQ